MRTITTGSATGGRSRIRQSPTGVAFPLPVGSGNDLDRSQGLPQRWYHSLEALSGDVQITDLDVMDIRLDGSNTSSINAVVDGEIVRRRRSRSRGLRARCESPLRMRGC